MDSQARGALAAVEALTWVETPFHEQQSAKGCGCDCKGLIAGVMRECGFPEGSSIHARSTAYNLGRPGGIPLQTFREGLDANFERMPRGTPLQPGDVLLHRAPSHGPPSHLSIVVSDTAVVHASPRGRRVKKASLQVLLAVAPLSTIYRLRPTPDQEVSLPECL